MSKYRFLSSAMAAFERAVVAPEYRDYNREGDLIALRDAPGPFSVFEYDTDEVHVKECPEYQHDCWKEGCGTTWSTGGEIGVCLIDAAGITWRDAGIVVRGGLGF
jgi:hypothetical protein